MAKKARGDSFFQADKFTRHLRDLLDTLPSESDKQKVSSQLDVLIRFLIDLRTQIESIPTQRDAAAAGIAVDQLASLFAEAKSNPIIAAAIGIKSTKPPSKRSTITSEEVERVKSTITRFEAMTIDEIRTALDKMSRRDLELIAAQMGLRTTQRTTQEALAHQLATKITNARGYRILREGTTER
jgi:hypothetical protein